MNVATVLQDLLSISKLWHHAFWPSDITIHLVLPVLRVRPPSLQACNISCLSSRPTLHNSFKPHIYILVSQVVSFLQVSD